MKILISYDISLVSGEGKRRLRRVAKVCVNYGQRVQNSVFECEVDWSHFLELKSTLLREIDEEKDSLRIYHLGNDYSSKIEHFGTHIVPDLKVDTLIV